MTLNEDLARRIGGFQRNALIAGAVGAVLCLVGAFVDPARFYGSYLFAFVFFTNLSLGCFGLLMLHHMTNGKWSFAIQRYLEAGTLTLPLMALLFIPIIFGMYRLYPWTNPGAMNETVIKKLSYLNMPFWIGRTVFYFLIWTVMGLLLTRWSRAQDDGADPVRMTVLLRRLSAPGLVIYSLTVTFAAVDWAMSLEPRWFSSIYGMLFMAGQGLGALSLMAILLRLFSTARPVSDIISPNIFHDLGNMILAFVVLWAYMSFSQFLITWAGNLPEEIPWYVRRLNLSWRTIGLFLIVLHFFVPFMLLLLRRSKRAPQILWKIAAGILVMRIVDVYWQTQPALHPDGVSLHWLDLASLLGVGGFWAAYGLQMLKGAPLLALRDPRFAIVPRPATEASHG